MQRATPSGSRSMRAPERLEQVGRAGEARRRAVAVLGDRAARAGGDQRGGGRDVERAPPAARAGGVEQVLALGRHVRGQRPHRARQPGELVDRLALRPQRDQEAGDLGLRDLAVHDLGEHLRGLVGAQVAARGERVDRAREDRAFGIGGARRRKFASSSLPSSVSTDSGWNCTPSAGSSRWRSAHQHAAAARGLLQAVGQLGIDDQRVIAPDRQRRRQPAEDRAAVVLDRRSPCRAPAGAARTRPPNACASA